MITTHPTPLHVVGDEDSSKRRQILDGARKVFMDLGFDGASMGEIARSAGVSKGTLYVYFDDKNRLFEAIVGADRAGGQKRDADIPRGLSGETWLTAADRPAPHDQCSATSRTSPVSLIVGIQNLAITGITSRLQIGDRSMPPTMTQASGC